MLLLSETVLVIVIGFSRLDAFDYDNEHEHRPCGLSTKLEYPIGNLTSWTPIPLGSPTDSLHRFAAVATD